MRDICSEFENVFVDNNQPENIPYMKEQESECKCCKPAPAPNPKEYFRHNPVINKPYSDNPAPGPYRPDVMVESIETVPNTYMAPPHHHHHHKHHHPPDRSCHPMEWQEDHRYVTKRELNYILSNIAEADIFRDLSCDGTTVSVGGIRKGTKFKKLTFAQLMCLMLYPKDGTAETDYVYETNDGRTIRNSEVKYPIGGFKEGDSLEGMSISDIIEVMLCGKNPWGTYRWVSEPVRLDAGTVTIEDIETGFPYLVSDYSPKHKYELHVVGEGDVTDDDSEWVYDEIIAHQECCCCKQKTNVSIEGFPKDMKWSYNPETKKITLHSTEILDKNITVVMVRR